MSRLFGRRDEVPFGDLDAYSRAGLVVYEQFEAVELRRSLRGAEGRDPFFVEQHLQVEEAASWNAYACQLLADTFVRSLREHHPGATGIDRAAAAQALAWYVEAEPWLSRARQAAANPEYELDVALPATLPGSAVPTTERPQFNALLEVTRLLRESAEGGLDAFRRGLPASRASHPGLARLEQLLARVTSAADYAEGLWSPTASATVHVAVESRMKDAVARAYELGQLLLCPLLLDGPLPSPRRSARRSPAAAQRAPDQARTGGPPVAAPRRWPSVGEPGFDPWCLADAHARGALKADPGRHRELDALWRSHPTPSVLVGLQNALEEAIGRGDCAYATRERSGAWLGHHHACPWPGILRATRSFTLGGHAVAAQTLFCLDVRDGRRGILADRFEPAADGGLIAASERRVRVPAPGEPGFDVWRLSDPRARRRLRVDAEAMGGVEAAWSDPARAVALQEAVEEAIGRGDVAVATRPNGTWLGSYGRPPFAPVYAATRAVEVAGVHVPGGSHFTLVIAGDDARVVVGPVADEELYGAAQPTRGADRPRPSPPARPRVVRPGEEGFDPWSLTDPHARGARRAQPEAAVVLADFWTGGRHGALVDAQEQLLLALERDDVAYATREDSGAWLGYLDVCPWPPILVARRVTRLCGRRLAPGERFCLDPLHDPPSLLTSPFVHGTGEAQAWTHPHHDRRPAASAPAARPDPPFDPWCLTDPHARGRLRQDPTTTAALERFWGEDPDRDATLDVGRQLAAALERGDVVYATRPGSAAWAEASAAPPWTPVLEARRVLRVGGTRFAAGDRLAYVPRDDRGDWIRAVRHR